MNLWSKFQLNLTVNELGKESLLKLHTLEKLSPPTTRSFCPTNQN